MGLSTHSLHQAGSDQLVARMFPVLIVAAWVAEECSAASYRLVAAPRGSPMRKKMDEERKGLGTYAARALACPLAVGP